MKNKKYRTLVGIALLSSLVVFEGCTFLQGSNLNGVGLHEGSVTTLGYRISSGDYAVQLQTPLTEQCKTVKNVSVKVLVDGVEEVSFVTTDPDLASATWTKTSSGSGVYAPHASINGDILSLDQSTPNTTASFPPAPWVMKFVMMTNYSDEACGQVQVQEKTLNFNFKMSAGGVSHLLLTAGSPTSDISMIASTVGSDLGVSTLSNQPVEMFSNGVSKGLWTTDAQALTINSDEDTKVQVITYGNTSAELNPFGVPRSILDGKQHSDESYVHVGSVSGAYSQLEGHGTGLTATAFCLQVNFQIGTLGVYSGETLSNVKSTGYNPDGSLMFTTNSAAVAGVSTGLYCASGAGYMHGCVEFQTASGKAFSHCGNVDFFQ
jgi:hypothetical protein